MYVKYLFLVEWCGVDSPSVGLTMHFSFALYLKTNRTCSLTTIGFWMTIMSEKIRRKIWAFTVLGYYVARWVAAYQLLTYTM
jgi:hypothetical protein